jgi:hypothetical protein
MKGPHATIHHTCFLSAIQALFHHLTPQIAGVEVLLSEGMKRALQLPISLP